MQLTLVYNILLGLAFIVGFLLVTIILVTGKGDAMGGGGGSVRTTFKGKASFDDQMSQFTVGLGIAFTILILALDFLIHKTNS